MTPFMFRVHELVGDSADSPDPEVRLSEPLPVGISADRHVAVRSLAEQLVCEANALLPPEVQLSLVDDVTGGQLGFTMTCRESSATVSTTFGAGRAVGQLRRNGRADAQPVELEDADALPDLVLSLLVDAGVDRRLELR